MGDIKKELALWVREAREFKGLTQDQLGEILGRTKANISSMENARHEPSYTQLLAIVKATGFSKPFPGMVEPVRLNNLRLEQAGFPFKKLSFEKIQHLNDYELGQLEAAVILSAATLDLDVIHDNGSVKEQAPAKSAKALGNR